MQIYTPLPFAYRYLLSEHHKQRQGNHLPAALNHPSVHLLLATGEHKI